MNVGPFGALKFFRIILKLRNLNSLIVPKNWKRGPFGKKFEGTFWRYRKFFEKCLTKPEKKERGAFCFGMIFYFMSVSEALDAFKMKYKLLMVEVHNAQKMDRSR